jgi:hypothetical protein
MDHSQTSPVSAIFTSALLLSAIWWMIHAVG